MINLTINDQKIELREDKTILEAALDAGLYIPHLCYHPQVGPSVEMKSVKRVYQGGIKITGSEGISFDGCNLCLVEIEGERDLSRSCKRLAQDGMRIRTDTDNLQRRRKENLAKILESHPHACLLCPQALGCDRKICSVQVPEEERCCFKFGICELQKVSEFIGVEKGLPPYTPRKIPVIPDEPLINRDYNLCIGCLRCVGICKETRGADALGFTVKEGKVVVGSRGPTLGESGCRFCGFCVEVCPTGALEDKGVGAGERKSYLIPCVNKCPAGIDIPGYIRLIGEKRYEDAIRVIRDRAPLPGILGRVCYHPCETACRRGVLDEPVAICALKRAAADRVKDLPLLPDAREKKERGVAVIGSGPAGLTAAYYLKRLGYSITVYEALPSAGGMLRVGIPPYRLPRDVLDREIESIAKGGVEIKTGHRVESIEEVLSGGFAALFVAVGAHRAIKLGIPGEDNDHIMDGIAFLRKVNLGQEVSLGDRVAVIGGGNAAIDSARSAVRMRATSVTIFYRRSREEMPAYREEIEAALDEGVGIECQIAPKRFRAGNGGVVVEFIRTEMGERDSDNRRRPIPIEGSEFSAKFDTVIAAVGQIAETVNGLEIPESAKGRGDEHLGDGVFIGGDCLKGPATVIDAIASGRRGAALIDRFLGGDGDLDHISPKPPETISLSGVQCGNVEQKRCLVPALSPGERTKSFSEVTLGLEEKVARDEARRCLGCDLRFMIKPVVLPPERRLPLTKESVAGLPKAEGVYVLYNEKQEIYKISGVEDIREALLEELENKREARFFDYEEDPMFTSRERQLVQQYLKKTGTMPPGNEELDDLF